MRTLTLRCTVAGHDYERTEELPDPDERLDTLNLWVAEVETEFNEQIENVEAIVRETL